VDGFRNGFPVPVGGDDDPDAYMMWCGDGFHCF
jgi:hypothetical protein